MAVTQNTLIGKSRGSVGNTTFTKWKGLNVLKSKAVNNYSDPTQEQLSNNSKFAVMQAFMRSIATFIIAGFKAMAVNKTEYNAFSQENPYSRTIGGTSPDYFVDPAEIIISKGPELPGSLVSAIGEDLNPNQITITWPADPTIPQDAPIYVAIFDSTTGALLGSSTGVTTFGDLSVDVNATGIGPNWLDHVAYIFFVNPSNGKACDSILVAKQ